MKLNLSQAWRLKMTESDEGNGVISVGGLVGRAGEVCHLDKIKEAVKEFEAIQNQYRSYGAMDTEPDGVFQILMVRAFKKENPTIPHDGDGWELYSIAKDDLRYPHKNFAVSALCNAASKVVNLIQTCPINESDILKKYLQGYCWRIDWE